MLLYTLRIVLSRMFISKPVWNFPEDQPDFISEKDTNMALYHQLC